MAKRIMNTIGVSVVSFAVAGLVAFGVAASATAANATEAPTVAEAIPIVSTTGAAGILAD